ADPAAAETSWRAEGGEIIRAAYTKRRDDDDFTQPGTLYRKVLDRSAKERLVGNISGHAAQGVEPRVLTRVIEYWTKVDPELGARVAQTLQLGDGNHPAAGSLAGSTVTSGQR
ncbi:MAG: catalase-related domain-containing protein, partial [Candidatus Dormibacteria bacterium]